MASCPAICVLLKPMYFFSCRYYKESLYEVLKMCMLKVFCLITRLFN